MTALLRKLIIRKPGWPAELKHHLLCKAESLYASGLAAINREYEAESASLRAKKFTQPQFAQKTIAAARAALHAQYAAARAEREAFEVWVCALREQLNNHHEATAAALREQVRVAGEKDDATRSEVREARTEAASSWNGLGEQRRLLAKKRREKMDDLLKTTLDQLRMYLTGLTTGAGAALQAALADSAARRNADSTEQAPNAAEDTTASEAQQAAVYAARMAKQAQAKQAKNTPPAKRAGGAASC